MQNAFCSQMPDQQENAGISLTAYVRICEIISFGIQENDDFRTHRQQTDSIGGPQSEYSLIVVYIVFEKCVLYDHDIN